MDLAGRVTAQRAEWAASLRGGEARVWGMTGAERLSRIFRRLGLQEVKPQSSAGVVVVRADWVYDESLIAALARRPRSVLVAPDGSPLAAHVSPFQQNAVAAALEAGDAASPALMGLERLDPGALAYNEVLRKREAPVLEPLASAAVRRVEARLFQGSYKGVTDIVTKRVWPRPARIVTRWCALARLTPNHVTLAGVVLAAAAVALFWSGRFGWGLALGWMMTFLDTVDGKLARVTLTSSKLGDTLDHGVDLIHPPFWWWAWWMGVQQGPHPLPYATPMLAVVLGGYVAQRVEEGLFIQRFGFHMHAWRPFDSWFREIAARRNPNLILLTGACLFGRPDVGFAAVALWTAASFFVHLAQLGQAWALPREQVRSWLAR
jgi:phosphatidylglycerophosphate synthase